MENNISFKSKIKFVDKNTFVKLAGGEKIDHIHRPMGFADEFYTLDVKTCTGASITTPFKEAYGLHIYDCENTNKTLAQKLNFALHFFNNKPERALIIGSKNRPDRPFSKPNFELVKQVLEKHVKYISSFEEQTQKMAQTCFHYDTKTDTYNILTRFIKNDQVDYIKNLKDLLENFKHIKIAKGDELYIGEKQITSKTCPEIFESKTRLQINYKH